MTPHWWHADHTGDVECLRCGATPGSADASFPCDAVPPQPPPLSHPPRIITYPNTERENTVNTTTPQRRGAARDVYLYVSRHLSDGRPFTPEDLTKPLDLLKWQAVNALNHMIRTEGFESIERVSRGVWRWTGPEFVEEQTETETEAKDDHILIRILANVDGRLLVIDTDSESVYWMDSIS